MRCQRRNEKVMSQDNKRNFILHGSILAMAGIFVRIIEWFIEFGA